MSVRLRLLSDLHLEHDPWVPPEAEQDLVVLAGDIHNGLLGVEWAGRHFACPVIYVPGNHEYDFLQFEAMRSVLEHAAKPDHVHVLDNKALVVNGVRFLRTTLWTDFALNSDVNKAVGDAARCMTDYVRIRMGDRPLLPQDTIALHHTARAWLEQALAQPFAGKTVVVSHHCPHPSCIAPKFKDSPANPGFVSDLTDILSSNEIAVWCHGHTHTSLNHYVGATRIMCNPRGYPEQGHSENLQFDPSLVIEI